MGRDEMRAADADRQAVADKLRAALDEGRLDLGEYDERLQRAYAAKTYGDLKGLLTDLPVAGVASPAVLIQDHLTRRWLVHVWREYFPTVALTFAIWLVSSIAAQDLLYFWPIWVAGPWGLVLIWRTVGGLAQGEPQAWQAKIDKAERKKQLKKERKALEAEAIQRGELPEARKKSA
jgi:uncharacterized protein DUF1707